VRRNVEKIKLTKVRRNVEKSYQTRWLQMLYSRERHYQRTKMQRQVEETLRLIRYATTNLRKNVIRQNQFRKNVCNSVTEERQTDKLDYCSGTINYGETYMRQLVSH